MRHVRDQLANIERKPHRPCFEFFGNLTHVGGPFTTSTKPSAAHSQLHNQLPDYPITQLPD
jgi:hypothetical protein